MNAQNYLICIGGLPGAGKTTLVERLTQSEPLRDTVVINSDAVRKELNGVNPTDTLPKSAYTKEKSQIVFDEMERRTRDGLNEGKQVIVETLFITLESRDLYADIAKESGAELIQLWLDVPLDKLIQRASTRVNNVSDAGADEVKLFSEMYKDQDIRWPKIEASGSRDQTLDGVIRALAEKGVYSHFSQNAPGLLQ